MDLTVAAIPGFFATMGLEHRVLRRRAERTGPSAGDYETRDTLASLSMGVGSLVLPPLIARALQPVTPGRGRYGRVLVAAAVAAAAVTTAADVVARRQDPATPPLAARADGEPADPERATRPAARPSGAARLARRLSASSSVVAVSAGVVAGTTTWASRTAGRRLWERSGHRRDLGTGLLPVLGAVFAWDAIYYWSHRLQHESRWLWAIHVVHHSSERYNLSTALRQPVGEAFGAFPPYGAMALVGFRPELIEVARGVNLLYQYWIHTETIDRLGPAEAVLNTPSHHRVHHGSNPRYLDRNHGSILIVWDRLFGTFQPEDEPVVYGLTRNIDTFNPLRIATHEHRDILRDVARSTTWRDRLGFVFRGPGWAYRRHAAEGRPHAGDEASPSDPAGAAA